MSGQAADMEGRRAPELMRSRFARPFLAMFSRAPRKRLAGRGALIALVGGDGAGKSTAVDALYRWLARDFRTIKVHMGRPRWSWTTIAVRGAIKLGRQLGLFRHARPYDRFAPDGAAPAFAGYPALLWELCAARDRYRTYARARRFARRGGLVICDRFPLPQLTLMDARQIERMAGARRSRLPIKLLSRLERRYYRSIEPPDLLIVLKIDPDIAVRRKTSEDSVAVRERCREIWTADWQATPAHVIDASQPQAQVLSELKDLIWSKL